MKAFPQVALCASLSLVLAFGAAGCKNNSSPDSTNDANTQGASANTDPSQTGDMSQDPANANVAPVSNATDNTGEPAGSYASSGQFTRGHQPQAAPNGASDQAAQRQYAADQYGVDGQGRPYTNQTDPYTNYSSESNYGDYSNYYTPVEYAPQPPPQLPQYQQPPVPGPDYIWTPGSWQYDQGQGYYWVPGAWVSAPYQGALWTPGWWGYNNGRYGWHRGYWGRHIGYYGGIDYGFGYVGYGYQGGYWHGDHFAYNRAVNNVNTTVVRNIYNYRITNVHVTRVSYNGGNGGIDRKPRPAEIEAMHEQHNPPMSSQLQLRQEAKNNRQNFAKVSHDRPAMAVVSHPVPADQNVRPPQPVRYEARNQGPNPGGPAQQAPVQPRFLHQQQSGNAMQRNGQQANQGGRNNAAQHASNGPEGNRAGQPPRQARGEYGAQPPEQRPVARPQQPMHSGAQRGAERGPANGGSREPQHLGGASHPVQPNRPEAHRPEIPRGQAGHANQHGNQAHGNKQRDERNEKNNGQDRRPQ